MQEVWKDVVGYEGYYQVSNLGRVKSLRTKAYSPKEKCAIVVMRERVLRQSPNVKTYLNVSLRKSGTKNTQKVHRLVAKAFIPNPDNLPQVNHKDENKQNNCVENLEWCTNQYNINYGTARARMAEKRKKKVIQLSASGEVVNKWGSMKEAAEDLGIGYNTMNRWLSRSVKPRKYKNYTFKTVKE